MAAASSFHRRLRAVWRRIAPTTARRVLAICTVFGVMVGTAVYAVRTPSASPPVPSAEQDADNPAARFSTTGVGQVLFAQRGGENCRRVLFDNRTGASLEAGEVYCGQEAPRTVAPSGVDRMVTVRKSFQK